ncbi:zinc finger protein 69-like isoform X3 [Diabrotica virgifera virgifera]|uniref:C2H2-type domain-containing protein n=1 Tax=Diabrotica virgifera virgifera TaxID=50390 RepID=A0ABM5IX73_DIAVI|nr:zinc finger protein 69-like isoform X3 [Diabrotica virgifera virgifera]
MERNEGNEDTVINIKVENRVVVKPEFIKNEPVPVYLNKYVDDYWHGGSDIRLDQIKTELSDEQNQDDLAQFQYLNSDVDNIKPEHTAKGSQSSQDDGFKIEIKEEPNRESIHDTFDDPDCNKHSLKLEIEESEIKLMPYEEKQTNETDFLQETDTLEIMKTIEVHSSNKEQHTNHTAEEKTLKCEICFKQFSQANQLKIHSRMHTGQKSYSCENCFKQFSEAKTLNSHLRIHTGEKPYKCEICFKQFTRTESRSNLQKRRRTVV